MPLALLSLHDKTGLVDFAKALVARGFEVTAYCRSRYTPRGLAEHHDARREARATRRERAEGGDGGEDRCVGWCARSG